MLTRPDAITDADIERSVSDGWGRTPTAIEHAAVGFGSHHWWVTTGADRWFLTVDDLDDARWDSAKGRTDAASRLAAALTMARALHDAGLDFVVAPVPTRSHHVLSPVDERHVASLYPYVEGTGHDFGTPTTDAERLAVLDRLVAVHGAAIGGAHPTDGFALPERTALERAITDAGLSWGPGPYAEPVRALLHEHRGTLERALARYDGLVERVANRRPRMVPTHGEPHAGNRITTAHGIVLIDWDTALLAPPERDLWMLIDEDPEIVADYTARTDVVPDRTALDLYRLRWDLTDVSLFVAVLRAPHVDTEDTRVAWTALTRSLDPTRWERVD